MTATPDKLREDAKQWFREAKFGLFIHWGIYAVTGRGEWLRQHEQIKEDEYKKQIPQFTAAKFNAAKWAELAKRTGFRYMVITTKHHDGFCMFDAHNTDWKVTNSPAKRDVLRELTEAFEKEGIPVGFYYSIMDWHHPDYLPRLPFEAEDRPAEGHNVMDYIAYMREQLHQLLTEYGKAPFVLWYDGGWMNTPQSLGGAETNALCRKWHPGLLINDRHATKEDLITPEQKVPATGLTDDDGKPALWEACLTMTSYWWGYDRNETNFKEKDFLVRTLVDIVSKGGNLLLNIGPKADGTIQKEFVERLEYLGKWMNRYGDTIYGTTASPFDKLPFFGRVTTKGQTLFVHVFTWPQKGYIDLPNLKTPISRAYEYGHPEIRFEVKERSNSWRIFLPSMPLDTPVSVITVELSGTPKALPVTITPSARNVITLPILYGELVGPHGQRIRYEEENGMVVVGSWYRAPDRITWTVDTQEERTYSMEIQNLVKGEDGGAVYEVYVNPQLRPAFAPNGLPWNAEDAKNLFLNEPAITFTTRASFDRLQTRQLGTVTIPKGRNVICILLKDLNGHAPMRLVSAKLNKSTKA